MLYITFHRFRHFFFVFLLSFPLPLLFFFFLFLFSSFSSLLSYPTFYSSSSSSLSHPSPHFYSYHMILSPHLSPTPVLHHSRPTSNQLQTCRTNCSALKSVLNFLTINPFDLTYLSCKVKDSRWVLDLVTDYVSSSYF